MTKPPEEKDARLQLLDLYVRHAEEDVKHTRQVAILYFVAVAVCIIGFFLSL